MIKSPQVRGAASPETIDGSPGFLFRLASDWVYHARSIAQAAVGSYPTFSPLLPGRSGLFSVALAVNLSLTQAPPLSRGILPYDVRTFLSPANLLASE